MFHHRYRQGFGFYTLLIFVFYSLICLVNSMEREMTVNIEAGRKECFFQNLKIGQVLDLEYQVIDGGQGEIDISFQLYSPNDRNIITEYKKPESSHRYTVEEDGDHQLCFDNTISRFNSKTVFFELIIDSDADAWDFDFNSDNLPSPEDVYETQILALQETMQRVRAHLTKIRHLQDQQRAFEARDRNIAESNFTRVNLWSFAQILVMIFVGIMQVVMLKSLFDNTSHVHKLFRKNIS
ncbi:transmembrane emp24 domain-containing protein 5-like [Ischnura elegans]|uniref:transmembrane emp24 domain-containing protein 5-like n=1 Tax=Ischnura elegans TaxID=197161 RepID=UPI001ED86CAF|nr:transmembrane emp24 domain-containing protein 5-like [Ischnura elegans]